MEEPIKVVSRHRGKSYRTVEIPQAELDNAKELREKLSLIFKYGQNDFQRKNYPSATADDLIFFEDKVYLIAGVGFIELSKKLATDIHFLYIRLETEYEKVIASKNDGYDYEAIRAKARTLFKDNQLGYFI